MSVLSPVSLLDECGGGGDWLCLSCPTVAQQIGPERRQ